MGPEICCVQCGGALSDASEGALGCPSCRLSFPLEDGIADLMPRAWSAGLRTDAERRLERVLSDLQAWRAERDAEPREAAQAKDTGHRDRLTAILRGAGVGGDVLDVGGCNGWLAELLPPDHRLAVVDPAPRPAKSGEVRITRAVAEHLPFRDASFDWVLMISCFDYFTDPDAAVDEAWRVLRPGGRLLLFVPVYPPPVARFLDPDQGTERLRAAFDPRVWWKLGARRASAEIRAGFRGRPRFHLHYYTADGVLSRLERSFELMSRQEGAGSISHVLVATLRRRDVTARAPRTSAR